MAFSKPEPSAPRVSISTPFGEIVAQIEVAHAPVTGGNFLRHVDQNLYGGASFYRAARPDNVSHPPAMRVIQGGVAPDCQGMPLPPIAHEDTARTGLRHVNGALSMARWATGTAGSEFFIVIGDAPELDHGGAFDEGYAVFGRVVLGMEIVRMINGLETVACASLPYLDGQRLRNPVPLEIARERNEGA